MARPFPQLTHPIVQAPMAGGPSTPQLAAAVSNAGGFGFIAAGYKSVDATAADLQATRQLTARSFGMNIFMPGMGAPADADAIARYVATLVEEARRHGVELGQPRMDDDGFQQKVELAISARVPVVSFAFGCPTPEMIERLHRADISVWITVTAVDEAVTAERAGADAVIAQGVEAGGHRGSFSDEDGRGELGVLALIRLVRAAIHLPVVAAGGVGDGAAIAAVLAAGASAAQLGTAFLLCPESGTSEPHRRAIQAGGRTALTRAFSGRRARGIVNRFMVDHPDAPSAYPQLHHVTSPLRAAGRKAGDSDVINLWAGEAFALARAVPAEEVVRTLSADARTALGAAARTWSAEPEGGR